jgi:hypothetical protein
MSYQGMAMPLQSWRYCYISVYAWMQQTFIAARTCWYLGCSVAQSVDHHVLLSFIRHKHSTTFHDCLKSLDNLVEAACCTLFLSKTSDAEWGTLAMLNDCHDFRSKRDFFDGES